MGWFETQNETPDDEVCAGLSPDTWCGTCPDCREGIDQWRQDNGEEDA